MRRHTRLLRLCFFYCGAFYSHRGHRWRILDYCVKLIRFDSWCSSTFVRCNNLWADHPRRVLPSIVLLILRVLLNHLTCFVHSLEGTFALISCVRVEAENLCHLLFIFLLFCFNLRLHQFFLTSASLLPQSLVTTMDYSGKLLWGYAVQSTIRIDLIIFKSVIKANQVARDFDSWVWL